MSAPSDRVPALRLFLSFLVLGTTSFGGPAMIAHIKDLSLRRNRWLSEESFRDGVALCQSVPGATAMQMSAYVGLRAGGLRGAAASYIGFGTPAFLLMLTLSAFYTGSREMPVAVSLFRGLQVLVVAILAHATFVFGRDIAKRPWDLLFAPASAACFAAGVSPFLVVIGAGIVGIVAFRGSPAVSPSGAGGEAERVPRALFLFAALVLAGVAALRFLDGKLFSLAALMLRIDLFAFGGGFAALPLMFHEIVNVRGWMSGPTFMDGIALGQVTPGPIVITSTFVGYMVRGVPGAVAATAAIFTPSFIVLAAAVPFLERMKRSRHYAGATRGILGSFVGLLFYMTVRFAWAVPWDAVKALFAAAALVALFRKAGILYVVLAGALLSVLIFR
ncbi:MAG: chromate efflux transporter [Thermodesulfobacteriota bacterium]